MDHQAQSATHEIAEIVVKDYRKFGPPLAENDWFDLARCMASAFMSEGARDEIVKEAEQEVKAHGLGATVLTRIVNLREEGSEQAALASLRGTVNHDRWQNVWFMEGTDREEVLAHITEKSGRLVDGLSQELEATSRSSMKIDVQEERDESRFQQIPVVWCHWLVSFDPQLSFTFVFGASKASAGCGPRIWTRGWQRAYTSCRASLHFATLMDLCHVQNRENVAKLQRPSCTARRRCDRRRRLLCCARVTGIFCVAHESHQRIGQYFTISRMRRITSDAISAQTPVNMEDGPYL